ncbi:MAG: B12-binding domain-containing radical SAM protein, partial [Rhodospirillaceae bacterium]
GAAERAGYHVPFRDYQTVSDVDPLNPNVFLDFITAETRAIALSCMSNLLPLVLFTTKILKEQDPSKLIILGGIGPSGVADRLMEVYPHVDILALGEGEETFVDLLDHMHAGKPLSEVCGVLYRDRSGAVQKSQPRSRNRALDGLPDPAYHRINMQSYETVGIQTARGCPFPCTFCDVSVYWGRKSTYRSIDLVMDEMERLEAFGFDKVTILDDTFILKRDRVRQFCQAWTDRGLSIEWSAYCRVDLLDDPLMEMLADHGCYRVFLGIESGSNNVLSKISKPLDFDHMVRAVKKLQQRVNVRCNLIWGFPFETMEDLKETVHLMFYLRTLGTDVSLSLLSPLPLSTLYEQKQFPIVLREDLDLQSSVVSSRFFLPDGSALVDGKPVDLIRMIRAEPEVFPGFYTFEDPLFEEKLAYLTSMGLEVEKLERQ